MNKLNDLEIIKVATTNRTEAQTTAVSSAVDLQRCAGVMFMATLATASGSKNLLKVQVSDLSDFSAGVSDLQGAVAIPKADGEMCVIDVTAEAAGHRYARAAVVRAGIAAVLPEIFAIKYGVPKQPVSNQGTGVSSACVAIPGTEVTPLDYIYTPAMVTPVDAGTDIALTTEVEGSVFAATGTLALSAARFQITEVQYDGETELPHDWDASVVDEIAVAEEGAAYLTLAGTELENSTEYAVRTKQFSGSNNEIESDWSAAFTFTTVAAG